MSFSKNLSELRRKRGKSQRAVAVDLHISQSLLSHYENGARQPGFEFVLRACAYYGVSADYLLGRPDSMPFVGGALESAQNSLKDALTDADALRVSVERYLTLAARKMAIAISGQADALTLAAIDAQLALAELDVLRQTENFEAPLSPELEIEIAEIIASARKSGADDAPNMEI